MPSIDARCNLLPNAHLESFWDALWLGIWPLLCFIPESNRTTGNIGVEYLIFKYRLNIYEEKFYPINHCLLGVPGSKVQDIKNVYSHAQGLSQCSNFIKKNNLIENVRADTAGSAQYVSKSKIIEEAAIASKESAKIYNLEVLASNIQDLSLIHISEPTRPY